MRDRLRLTTILIGLILMSVSVPARSAAAISEDDKQRFSDAMKANRAGNYFESSKILRALLNKHTNWGLVHLQLGILELSINPDPAPAQKLLERATILLPTNPRAHFQLGMAHITAGNCGLALSHLKQAISLRPKFTQAHQQKAACEELEGNLAQAIESLETLLRLKRRNTAAMAELARLYELDGQPELSEANFRQLLKYEPKVHFHWLNLGYFLRRQGRAEEARKAFDEAERLRPRPQRKMRPLPRSSDL